MGFDIRLPIGMLFTMFGILLGIYGAATRGSLMYSNHSLGINVNFWWGLILVFFGLSMLLLRRLRPLEKLTGPDRKREEVRNMSGKH